MQKNHSISLLETLSYYDYFRVYFCCYFSVAKLRIYIMWGMWYHIWYTYGLVCHALVMELIIQNVLLA